MVRTWGLCHEPTLPVVWGRYGALRRPPRDSEAHGGGGGHGVQVWSKTLHRVRPLQVLPSEPSPTPCNPPNAPSTAAITPTASCPLGRTSRVVSAHTGSPAVLSLAAEPPGDPDRWSCPTLVGASLGGGLCNLRPVRMGQGGRGGWGSGSSVLPSGRGSSMRANGVHGAWGKN